MRKKSVRHKERIWKKLAVLCAASAMLLGSTHPVSAESDEQLCEDRGKTYTKVRGTILNNAVMPGTTLGTVHLRLGDKRNGLKMKCGLLGQDQSGIGDQGITFLHTFVCDDQITDTGSGETLHSQLTVFTTGSGDFMACLPPFPAGAAYGSFHEVSTPVSGWGRGLFSGILEDEGEIRINGTINCLFAIDMEFEGWVCLP